MRRAVAFIKATTTHTNLRALGVRPLPALAALLLFNTPLHVRGEGLGPRLAQADKLATKTDFDLPAQPLGTALKQFADQAGIQILFEEKVVDGLQAPAIKAHESATQVLKTLLNHTDLEFTAKDQTVAVRKKTSAGSSSAAYRGTSWSLNANAVQLAHDDQNTSNSEGQNNQNSKENPDSGTLESENKPVLQEVVITAQKRSGTVQDTPISVTVVSGEDIQDRGITDFNDLAQSTPGVSVKTSGPGQTEFEMRGLSSAGGSSATVGFYLDDTPLTAPTFSSSGKVVIDPNLYDLDRVEILRGPQGTLYGSGSMGGTIKLVTNQPNLTTPSASTQAIVSDTDGGGLNHAENFMVNLPLVDDVLALRIVGSEAYTSGWIDRIVLAPGAFPLPANGGFTRGNVLAAPVAADYRNVNDTQLFGGRASLLWQPTDDLAITPALFWQRISQGGPNLFDSDPGTLAHYEPFNVPEPDSDRFAMASLNMVYKFKAFDVTSTSAYWDRLQTGTEDFAEGNLWGFGLPSFYSPTGSGAGLAGTQALGTRQTSEELRFTSSGDTRFKWLVGSFYSNFGSPFTYSSYVPGDTLIGINPLNYASIYTKIRQTAVFSEESYEIAHGLEATVGLRWYSYQSPTSFNLLGQSSSDPTGAQQLIRTNASAKGFSPKYNLSYEPNQDLMIYGTVAKGFRPGGGNIPTPTGASSLGQACLTSLEGIGLTASPTSFSPDDVWSYELGEKARFLDDRITVNGDVYFESWDGVQQFVQLSCGFNFVNNAGKAQVYGSELETKAILIRGLTLSTSVGYTHARITQGSVEAGTVSGDLLQDVPDWTASARVAYSTPISRNLTLTARAENDYVDRRVDAAFYSRTPIPSYDLTNIRAGVSENNWSAFLFVNNVFNTRAWLGTNNNISINTPAYNRIATNMPLTVGLDVSYRFGNGH
jgi:iron complex outermembrane recepter protein